MQAGCWHSGCTAPRGSRAAGMSTRVNRFPQRSGSNPRVIEHAPVVLRINFAVGVARQNDSAPADATFATKTRVILPHGEAGVLRVVREHLGILSCRRAWRHVRIRGESARRVNRQNARFAHFVRCSPCPPGLPPRLAPFRLSCAPAMRGLRQAISGASRRQVRLCVLPSTCRVPPASPGA